MAIVLWNIRLGDSSLKMNVTITYTNDSEKITRDLSIDDLMKVRFKLNTKVPLPHMGENNPTVTLSISTIKNDFVKNSTIKMNIVSYNLGLGFATDGLLIHDNWSEWQLMGTGKSSKINANPIVYYNLFDIYINAYEVKIDTVSSKLYSDTDFTDFYLTTSEGYVAVHKSFLAVHSDVFKTMLSGEWKETAEGKINIEGVNLETLQHLKDYMYLGTIPKDGLCPLLLIAKRYLIEDLEKQCIRKLAETVNAEDLYSLIQFSCENNIPELAYAILHITQDRIVEKAHRIKKAKKLINSLNLERPTVKPSN